MPPSTSLPVSTVKTHQGFHSLRETATQGAAPSCRFTSLRAHGTGSENGGHWSIGTKSKNGRFNRACGTRVIAWRRIRLVPSAPRLRSYRGCPLSARSSLERLVCSRVNGADSCIEVFRQPALEGGRCLGFRPGCWRRRFSAILTWPEDGRRQIPGHDKQQQDRRGKEDTIKHVGVSKTSCCVNSGMVRLA